MRFSVWGLLIAAGFVAVACKAPSRDIPIIYVDAGPPDAGLQDASNPDASTSDGGDGGDGGLNCGAAAQACCNGTACNAGFVCQESLCLPPCGAQGQVCCNGTACNAGLFCRSAACYPPASDGGLSDGGDGGIDAGDGGA